MKMTMTGLSELRKRIAQLVTSLHDLHPAFLRAAVVVLDSAKRRIQSEDGGQWYISKAMAMNPRGTPLHRTGRLFNSFDLGGLNNDVIDITGGVSVGTSLEYAKYLQEGTKSYDRGSPLSTREGPRQHAHTGMPARRFLYMDEKLAEGVKTVFVAHLFGGAS